MCVSVAGSNPLLETQKITATPLGKSRRLLAESVDLALPDGGRLEFLTIPDKSDVFPDDDRILFWKRIW